LTEPRLESIDRVAGYSYRKKIYLHTLFALSDNYYVEINVQYDQILRTFV
jgi:hypothetical protein